MLGVRRRYWIALALAAATGLSAVLFPTSNDTGPAVGSPSSPADLAAATAAANRMKLPHDFARVTSFNPGMPCEGDRCFLVPRPTTAVAALVPTILRGVATYESKDTFCTSLHPPGRGTMQMCQFAASVTSKANIVVLVNPYIECTTRRRCRLTNESELLIDGLKP